MHLLRKIFSRNFSSIRSGPIIPIALDRSCLDNRGMINKVIKLKLQFLCMLMYKLHVKETQRCMRHAMIPKYILTPNLGFLPQIIYRYALSSTLLEMKPEVKVTVTWKTVGESPGSKMYLHTKYGMLP